MKTGQLVLFYQPKIDFKNNQIVGVEALIRWQHPTRGLIAPNEFIPVAEESGQIVDITKWAINHACKDISKWQAAGHGDVSVAINISIVDFRSGVLPQIVFKALSSHNINPNLLELEITESTIFEDTDHVQEQINKMSARGISFAIDDFGTGYSNLGYLNQFNVTILKIDQSFIRNIVDNSHNQHIVKAIISLSKSLAIENVAEGVEDLETADWLKINGCALGQGYYWAKPLSFVDFCQLLTKEYT